MEEQDPHLADQAALVESLLPRIMRTLFTLEPDHPSNELPLAQLRICSVLLAAGSLSMSALGKELHTSVSAVTQMADRLEAAGYVERCADPEDRRSRCLRLTPYGLGVMTSRHQARVERVASALAALPPEQRENLVQLLGTFLASSSGALSPDQTGAEIDRLT